MTKIQAWFMARRSPPKVYKLLQTRRSCGIAQPYLHHQWILRLSRDPVYGLRRRIVLSEEPRFIRRSLLLGASPGLAGAAGQLEVFHSAAPPLLFPLRHLLFGQPQRLRSNLDAADRLARKQNRKLFVGLIGTTRAQREEVGSVVLRRHLEKLATAEPNGAAGHT